MLLYRLSLYEWLASPGKMESQDNDHLVQSSDPDHPANLIPELCRKFYQLGWVTGRSHKVKLQAADRERDGGRHVDQAG